MSRSKPGNGLRKRRPVSELRKKFGSPETNAELVARLREEKKEKEEVKEIKAQVKHKNKNEFHFGFYSNKNGGDKMSMEELRKILKYIDCEILRCEKRIQSVVAPVKENSHIRFEEDSENCAAGENAAIEYASEDSCTSEEESAETSDSCITKDSSDSNPSVSEETVSSYYSEEECIMNEENSDSFGDSDSFHDAVENAKNETEASSIKKNKENIKQRRVYEKYLQDLIQRRQDVMDKILKLGKK